MKYFFYQLCAISLILAFSFKGFSQTPSQRQKAKPKGSTSFSYGYYEYLPSNYSSVSKHPVVIFLHGIGEKGDGSLKSLPKVLKNGPPKLVKNGKDFPFILITPQHPSGWWTGSSIKSLIEYIKSHYKVDANRIYITGLSAGGYGTWLAGQSNSDQLAAIVPVCGCGTSSQAPNLKNLPVWAFHNEKDPKVSSSCDVSMVSAVNKAGGKAKITLYDRAVHDAWTATYNNENMWEWLLSKRRGSVAQPAPSNDKPVVDAGSDKSITLPSNSTSLTAKASDDGKISSYSWSKVSGPGVSMSNVNSSTLKVSSLVAGAYVFKVTVKDNKGASASDQVKVTVKSKPVASSLTVNAGPDRSISLPDNTLTLSPNIEDKTGKITYTLWTKVSGPSVTMKNYTQKTLYLSHLVEGSYVFRLTVKDNLKKTVYDEVKVTVKKGSSNAESSTLTVNAGPDRVISLPFNKLTIAATTVDKAGKVTYTLWTKVSGPSVTMNNYSQKTLYLSNLVEGNYVFKLTVKDNLHKTAYDEVKVTVKGGSNSKSSSALTVNAGPDRVISSKKLTIAATTQDKTGKVTYTLWTKVSGPSVTMSNYSQKILYLSNLVEGTYIFRITVKDSKHATAYDEVKVVVKKSSARMGDDFTEAIVGEPSFKLYPNPAIDRFKIETGFEEEAQVKVVIINNRGTIVHQEEATTSYSNPVEINIANLSEGLYFVKVTSGNEEKTFRLIKQ